MKILAIDTTTPRGSVALVADGALAGEIHLTTEIDHSSRVLPMVEFLLKHLRLSIAGVDALAVASGPGSFTGIRVGLSTVQGLALAGGQPCIGIATLDALGLVARGQADWSWSLVHAYRGEVYAALYDRAGRRQGAYEALTLSELQTRSASLTGVIAIVGDAVEAARDSITSALPQARCLATPTYLAGAIGRLATERLALAPGQAPADLRPLYIRRADIGRSRA
ncbi:MAG: tRNA (adenosine(37)-N6)-threonylcarbamoyltransferase complex dimerization subunit type 1 TsaB [Vicinamibacteria bacterium]|jgi:tRNA threonylcarbamoyladenosine biosynthesis protein TsaB|nr:tRNA (adenosine(37)-N6)-threonylcarbamoyltransferase complex dimerization subunit type 1 TsaB [Vicinamibacteria bacterium]